MPADFEQGYRHAQAAGMDGLATVNLGVEPMDRAQRAVKRAGDVVFSGAFLVLLSPFLLVVALAVVLTSRGGAFYSQPRVGEHGRTFRMYKFRTMYRDADRRWHELACENGCDPALFKIRDDPRVTPVGRLLRRTRVDELPQLWNVLRGNMALVGPRPERPEFVQQLTAQIPFYGQRHAVRPGLTGWAQVRYAYGASVEDAMEKLQYDLYFIKNRSLALNFYILFETLKTIISRSGS
jgi:exopolysaccharide biosynthesis polyprenyl glycosylphosphotransferase